MEFLENIPLAPWTSFKIGGPARWFAEARTSDEVIQAVDFAQTRQIPFFILGGGSNLLVSDHGFDGLVLRIQSKGIGENVDLPGFRAFSVAAGESWEEFVTYAVNLDCGGIECLAGIPGTVGGTPIQNVGAYGQQVSDTISQVQVLDLSTVKTLNLDASTCEFGYRQSIFNQQGSGRFIILSVTFRLQEHAPACIEYRDLRDYFSEAAGVPSLARAAEAVREIRRRKGMVLIDGDPDTQSAGSFFKNPVVPLRQLSDIAKIAGLDRDTVPFFAAGLDTIKVPAAWLVEQAGFVKGHRKGNAAISSRHTLALTNQGGATAEEILALRTEIQERVAAKFHVELKMEPILVGF